MAGGPLGRGRRQLRVRRPLLADCVDALLADDSAGPVEVVVVDNGSTDGSVATLRARHPDVAVMEPHANLGYAPRRQPRDRGHAGAGGARLQPRHACSHPGSARRRARRVRGRRRRRGRRTAHREPRRHARTRRRGPRPAPASRSGTRCSAGSRRDNRFTRAYRQTDAAADVPRDVDWVSGAALWFRRAALDRVGGWDERYFMFLEDVDVCREITASGDRVRYEPGGGRDPRGRREPVARAGPLRGGPPPGRVPVPRQVVDRARAGWRCPPRPGSSAPARSVGRDAPR